MSKQYQATLVRGSTYIIGEKRFDAGKPQIISEELKKKLEISAVDVGTLTTSDGKEAVYQQKFKFVEVAGEAKAEKSKAEQLDELEGDGGVDFDEDEGDVDDAAPTPKPAAKKRGR